MRSKRKKKLKLTNQAKIIFSVLIIGIVLFSLSFRFFNKDTEEIHEIKEEEHYTLKIDYPVLANKTIEEEVKEFITSKKEEFLENAEKLKEVTETKLDLSITYTLTSLFDYQALHVNIYTYTGGAHYIKEDKSYYFHPKTGEQVDITNFLVSENKLEELANLAYYYTLKYYQDNNKEYDEAWIKEGTSAKKENFTNFNFSENGLELFFALYQVGPHSDGEITIEIPEEKLKGIIKEEYLSIEKENIQVSNPSKRDLTKFAGKKLIAFTFDDGPSDAPTNKLLDNLDKYDARVTFFVLGSRVNTYKDTLKRAYEMGNLIGSHTYSHLNLFKLGDYDIMKEVNNTNDAIEGIIGTRPDKLRAPYGNTNEHIRELSNMYSVLWDVDTEDWKYKDAEKIKDNIISHAHDGAIILLHDIYMTSIEGALLAMEELQDEYAFVTIDEMIELKGITLDKNKSYFNF